MTESRGVGIGKLYIYAPVLGLGVMVGDNVGKWAGMVGWKVWWAGTPIVSDRWK